MDNEYNDETIRISPPIIPERHTIEIRPGMPRTGEPPRIDGPSRPLDPNAPLSEIDDLDELIDYHLDFMSGGSGAGGAGRGRIGSSAAFPFRRGFPSVDEISTYVTFRGHAPWGIGISKNGLALYSAYLISKNAKLGRDECKASAHQFLVLHQFHHFLVDRAVSTLEGVLLLAGEPKNLWEPFHHKHRIDALEESAACAYAVRCCTHKSAHKTKATTNLVLQLIAAQPTAYRHVTKAGEIQSATGPISHQKAISELLSSYLKSASPHRGAANERQPGLHALMQYRDDLAGVDGDPFMNTPSSRHTTVGVTIA
ncbi:MAG: hypothetical protein ACKODA_01725 [Nevskiaceae bacterium]